ncbi:hypothetical protein [Streptomyces sp. RKAG337]|uniref:hypothetical protein n=1 Tax=Streptomyces sp. RKAG337 TaxID=2893404 RepID=UPI002033946A|nr:hypothetical protein [Streptomyces sp. RKAG337]MCM2430935.1 hypothetical protein [Streptomyces sp. RKAG337]
MRVEVWFDLGVPPDEVEYTAEFLWDFGSCPLPRRDDQIALGELLMTVREVRYKCTDADYIASRDHPVAPVEVELRLKLNKATRQARHAPQEFHEILSALPSVSELSVTGAGHGA